MANSETIMLSIKYIMFLAMELFVFAVIGAVLVAGLYHIVRDKVQEARRQDQVAPETPATASAGHSA